MYNFRGDLTDISAKIEALCPSPSNTEQSGAVQFAQNGTTYSVLDDSSTTASSTFTKIDIASCEGYINLMSNVINPCAPDIAVETKTPPPEDVSASNILRATMSMIAAALAAVLLLM